MGIMIHHWIVVTSAVDGLIERSHAVAKSAGCLVSEISAETVNGFRSFCVFPDGSKEGWEASAEGDKARDTFVRWLDEQRYDDGSNSLTWAELAIGELTWAKDDAKLLRHVYQPVPQSSAAEDP